MSEDADTGEWRTTTDHDRIRDWAAARGAVPSGIERPDGEMELRIETDRDPSHGERIPWDRFFELFESRELAFRYRESGVDGETGDECALVARTDPERGSSERKTVDPSGVESEQIAASDTGEGEPVVFDRTETEPAGSDETGGPPTTPPEESERGSVDGANAIVIDEIHENTAGPDEGDGADEYVVLENASESPVDLSGWTVENEAGRSYRFSDGTALDPGDRITLYSGEGTDTDTDRYWGTEEPVWRTRGETVVVTTPTGERVIEESYKGGR